jgi:hypothetical protein
MSFFRIEILIYSLLFRIMNKIKSFTSDVKKIVLENFKVLLVLI